MQTLRCPACQRKLRAPAELAGKVIRCPSCQARVPIAVPAADPATLPPPPSEPATLASPPDAAPTLTPSTTSAPTTAPSAVPGYELLGELGRGGMGVVYRARQVKLNRVVALKMILGGGHAGEEGLARFRAEAEAVARLQHPNIVQVFEVGEHDGLPFFSLEFVEGGSLEKKLAGVPMPERAAAALVESLARAVHAAHETRVIHRDLKPANVLLTGDGAPKVTDFGLAKKLDDQGQTRTGSVMGTPSYMAPEQASGSKEVGPAADIYALGAILYECLTGRPPFRAPTPLDTVLQVISDEPVPPTRLNPKVPRDLETIALKCLQKEPRRRYASAAALADDLRAYQEDRPIAARPVGRLTQAWRWCRRNRAVAALLAVVFVALSAGAAVSTAFGLRARASADESEKNYRQATEYARRIEDSERQSADTLYARNLTQAHREWLEANFFRARSFLELAPAERRGWEWDYLNRLFRAEQLSLRGHQSFVVAQAVSPAGDRVATVGVDATTRLWDARTGEELAQLAPPAYLIAFSPDGKRLAGAVRQAVALWDADTGRLLPLARLDHKLAGLDWVEKGRLLAAVTDDGEILFLDPDTGEEVRRCPRPVKLDRGRKTDRNRGHRPVFSPDGKYLAQGGVECLVRVWDTSTGEMRMEGTGHLLQVGQVAFSPDGKRLASPGGEGAVRIWDLETRKTIQQLRGHRSGVHAVAFSPDGRRLLTASKDTTARVWDLESGTSVMALSGHNSEVWGAAFSADGTRAFTSSPDSTVKVWDVRDRVRYSAEVESFFARNKMPDFGRASSQETWTYFGHASPVVGLALSADGRFAATGAAPGSESVSAVRIWDLDARREVRGLPVTGHRLNLPAISPDGKLVAVGSGDVLTSSAGELRLFELPGGKQLNVWKGPACQVVRPAFSPDGKHLACAFVSGAGQSRLVVRDLASGKEVFRQDRGSGLLGPAYLSDGRFVTGAADGIIRVQEGGTGAEVTSWKVPGRLTAVATGSGGAVAAGVSEGANATTLLFDASGQQKRELKGHVGAVLGLAFSPDGKRLFSCASDFTLKLWHAGTGHELLTWREHRDVAVQVAWSGDGRRLASVGHDGALKVWEGGSGAAAPKTDDWERLYRDDFERDAVGERWEPFNNSRWSVRDGMLRGDVAMTKHGGATFTYADVRLKGVDLPRTVEVSFRVRVSQPMLVAPQLRDPRRDRSLVPLVAGRSQPFGFAGAAVMLISGKEPPRFSLLGLPRERALTPGQDHRFRIVRTPDRLWLFIDDKEALAEEVPPIDGPQLGLQGSWSDQGSRVEIAFDDLEVRAPADAVRRRRVRSLVESRFDRLGSREAVRESIAEDGGLSPAEKKMAEGVLAALREDPDRLVRDSLAMSSRKDASPVERRLALRQAESAARLALGGEKRVESMRPEASRFLTAVALAKLRAGQATDAAADLKVAMEARRRQNGAAAVLQSAALALAAHHAGQVAQASEYRRQARLLLLDAPEHEAQEAKAWLEEMNAAVKPAADEAEVESALRAMDEADRAGWFHRDLKRYLAGRADDWREASGRGEEPEKCDVVLDRAAAARKRPWDFRQVTAGITRFRYEDVRAEKDGDGMTLRYAVAVQVQGAGWFRVWRAVVRMKKVGDVWKNAGGRSWPVRGLHRGRSTVFGPAFWKARDAEADAAQGEAKARALLDALRPAEALEVLKKLTDEKASAGLWALRGQAALEAADVDDARAAYRKAESLDPEAELHPGLNGPLLELTGQGGEVFSVAYLPSGELLSGGRDATLRRWSAAGKLVRADKVPEDPILAVDATRDGKRIATASRGVYLWDAEMKETRGHLTPQQAVYRIAFSRDGTKLVAATSAGKAHVFDSATGRSLLELRGHTRAVLGAVFSPDGKHVATASHDRTARLWDAATGAPIRTFGGDGGEMIRAAFSPDGATLATAGGGGEVILWDVKTAKVLHRFDAGKELAEVVTFSPDGGLLAAAGEIGVVRVWRVEDRKLLRVMRGHTKRVFSLSFSHDGKRLAAGGTEPTVRVWDVPEAR